MITYGFYADHVVFQIILNVLVVLSVTFTLNDCPTVAAACSRRRGCDTLSTSAVVVCVCVCAITVSSLTIMIRESFVSYSFP